MINMVKLIMLIGCLFLQSGYAIEKEVIAKVGGRPITNIEIFENIALNGGSPLNDVLSDPYLYGGAIDSMLPIILFEQYAAKNGIKITEQDAVDSLTKTANQRGKTLDEDILKNKTGYENIENTRKRLCKQKYNELLERRVIEHYNPDINNITEEDIQKWIPYRKTFHAPMGNPEQVKYKGVAVSADDYAKDHSVREELDKVKKRFNGGEDSNSIANEYSGREKYRNGIGHQPSDWVMTNIFEKQGLDAFSSWKSLKGRAVLVKVKELPVVMIMKIEDYQLDTQMSVEDAVKDKNLRHVCIDEARKYKFRIQKRDLIKKLENEMGGIKYRGNKDEICQKLASQYKEFRVEIQQSDPNFTPKI